MDILRGLDKAQVEVVTSTTGKFLVLAGAGAGKTGCLTKRIAYILQNRLAGPINILAVTFTNKAANEMKERLAELVETDLSMMWIGTFHSICVKILVSNGHEIGIPRNFTISDEDDKIAEIKAIGGKALSQDDIYKISSMISRAKENLMSPEEAKIDRLKIGISKQVAEIYEEYQSRLKKMNTLDFDDLIYFTIKLLQKCPHILKAYQTRFKFVLMDECQDSAPSNMMLINLLSGEKNLMLVGDIDQSIYGWRGADIGLALNFSKQPDVKTLRLENNYRSQGVIVKAANHVIQNNVKRLEKVSKTTKEDNHKIIYLKTDTPYDEAGFIAESVSRLIKNSKYKLSDFAVLYRTNNQARIVEEVLARNGIPSKIFGTISFYDRKEIKDAIAYIKLLVNQYDFLALQRVVNSPKRGIGEASINKIKALALEKNYSVLEVLSDLDNIPRLNKQTKDSLIKLRRDLLFFLQYVDHSDHASLLIDLFNVTGFYDSLDDNGKENIQELIKSVIEWSKDATIEDETVIDKTMYRFVKELGILSLDIEDSQRSRVKLMSVHGAKGLEFPIVFLIGMEETIFPHYAATSKASLEEERRLFYVAMTRAIDRLFITSNAERGGFGKTYKMKESRFLKEIPSEYLKRI